jgi:hypothetical protein
MEPLTILGLLFALIVLLAFFGPVVLSGWFYEAWWERYATTGIVAGLIWGYLFSKDAMPFGVTLLGGVSLMFVVGIFILIRTRRRGMFIFSMPMIATCLGFITSEALGAPATKYFCAFVGLCIGVELLVYYLLGQKVQLGLKSGETV